MIEPARFVSALRALGVTFSAGVPDSLLKEVCAAIEESAGPDEHLIAANEGGAVAAAVGYHLATAQIPLVYMQNSGLGNAINPLLSLVHPAVYAIPLLLLIGWRGAPGTRDEPQHVAQGAATPALLDALGVSYTILEADTTDLDRVLGDAVRRLANGPHALLVRAATFSASSRHHPAAIATPSLGRADVVQRVTDILDSDDLVVATTGMIARELFDSRERRGDGHERDFLVVGGMGHASQIAHVLAVHQPRRQVYCLDGDGALLMHMGVLAIVGTSAAANLRHIVLNNGAHDSVGAQPTVALTIDLPAIARAAGYRTFMRVTEPGELDAGLNALRRGAGPAFLEVQIAVGHRPGLGRPRSSPAEYKEAFMKSLAG